MTASETATSPASPPAGAGALLPKPEVPPWRLILTLALSGAIAGALLVVAFKATEGRIARNKQQALERAVLEVLGTAARFETRVVRDGQVAKEGSGEEVYLGFDAAGNAVGFAVVGAAPGYADEIRMIVGYDPGSRKILGMKVLECKETPGLGDAIVNDSAWCAQFPGKDASVEPVKPGESKGHPEREVDTITGATISTRTTIKVVREALDRVRPALDAWRPEGR